MNSLRVALLLGERPGSLHAFEITHCNFPSYLLTGPSGSLFLPSEVCRGHSSETAAFASTVTQLNRVLDPLLIVVLDWTQLNIAFKGWCSVGQ